MIVTANLKYFPQYYLAPHSMEAVHPDGLIEHQFGLYQGTVIACAKRVWDRLRNSEKSADKNLAILSSLRSPLTAGLLWEFKELI